MKSILIILVLAGTILVPASAGDGLRADSIDIGASVMIPVGSYADFMDFGTGGNVRLNISKPDSSWVFGLQLGGDWLHSIDPYSEVLADFYVLLDAGYRIQMGTGGVALVPRLSGGMITHLASGDFNTLNSESRAFYFDQYYGVQLELAIEPKRDDGEVSPIGFYIAPNFFVFPNQENQWGMNAGLNAGIRFKFQTSQADDTETARK